MTGQKKTKKFWEMKMSTEENAGDIFIYGDIVGNQWDETDTTASSFKSELDELGDLSKLNLYINSPGGSVFEGIAIYNMLKRHKAQVNVHVDALAASIASVIAMAGDTVTMPKNSMMMIHQPWALGIGNSTELRKLADDLDRIGQSSTQTYLEKAGQKLAEDQLKQMLDEETWLSADEAYQYGLCDVVEESNKMAACVDKELFQKYKNVPEQLKNQEKTAPSPEEMAKRKEIAEAAKNNSALINDILGGIHS